MKTLFLLALASSGFGCGAPPTAAAAGKTPPAAPANATPPAPKPASAPAAPAAPAPKRLTPDPLDASVQKLAAQLLDADAQVREDATDALLKMELAAVPYLLEVLVDDAGEYRKRVSPLLGKLTLTRGGALKPGATALLLDGLSSPSAALRRGAAAQLLFAAVAGDDTTKVIDALRAALKGDADKRVREQARTSLRFAAVDVIATHLLADTITPEAMDEHFDKLVRIGEPALDTLTKALAGIGEDLEEAENLRRIRAGIAPGENPTLLRQIAIYHHWETKGRRAVDRIRDREKAGK